MSIQVIYYSKHGSSREIAYTIGEKLGADTISDVRELKGITGDVVIVGSAIYAEAPHFEIMRVLRDEGKKLKDKPVALFVVCLAKERRKIGDVETGGPVYLRKMGRVLGRAPIAEKVFGGRFNPSKMDEGERKRTEEFYKKRGMPVVDISLFSTNEVDEFIQEIKMKMNHKMCGALRKNTFPSSY